MPQAWHAPAAIRKLLRSMWLRHRLLRRTHAIKYTRAQISEISLFIDVTINLSAADACLDFAVAGLSTEYDTHGMRITGCDLFQKVRPTHTRHGIIRYHHPDV